MGDDSLIGRSFELDKIMAGLEDDSLAGFVIVGAAGLGKTRLAHESAAAAEKLGYSTAHVTGTRAAASIPFGPFAQLVPDSGSSAGGLLGLLLRVSDAIVARAAPGQPLLLIVDDAHLLDDGSAALVHQLAHTATCKVVATIRTPGRSPDPITALWKDGLVERIDLEPLNESETAELAHSVLGAPVAGVTSRHLWQLSGGNALYTRELLRGASASGVLANHDGIWIEHVPLVAPDRLVELLAARLDNLPPEVSEAIDLVAVAGSLGFKLLARLTSPAACEDAEQRGLFEVRQDGRRSEAHMSHPLFAEVRRQRMAGTRFTRLEASLAEALGGTGARRRDDLLRLASWQLGAGVGGNAATLGQAARRARQMYDMSLARRLAQAAVDAGGGVEAGLVLAEAHFSSGAHAEAELVLQRLTKECSSESERAAVANARAYNLSILMGRPDDALRVLDDVLEEVTDANARAGLSARVGSISLFSGDPEAALKAVQASLSSDDPVVASRGFYVASCSLALLGRCSEAVAVAEEGLVVHRRCSESTQIPEAQLIGATLGRLAAGDLEDAERCWQEGYGACLEAGDREGTATYSLLSGMVAVEQGRLAAASRAFREGVAINRELSDTGALRWCIAGLVLAEAMAGKGSSAARSVADLDELGPIWIKIFDPTLVDRGRAWAKVAVGEVSSGRAALQAASEEAAVGRHRVAEAHLLHDMVRLGEAAGVEVRLSELASLVDSRLVAVFADHAASLVGGSAADLEGVSRRFAELGAGLLAAECAVRASKLHASAGRDRLARACEQEAIELARACGGVKVIGLEEATEDSRLTARELEVAGLAARGSSNKEISALLYISPRTVENHLQRIYMKLGVNGRDELASRLGPDASRS